MGGDKVLECMVIAALLFWVGGIMVSSILNIISAALSIWEHKERTKYQAELKKLKEDFYAEYNKPLEIRSDAILDNLNRRVLIFADTVAAAIGTPNS